MLVLGMNLKRQRRPSIRLGEVGDVPAASACWFSHETRDFLTQRSWQDGFVQIPELGESHSHGGGEILPGFANLAHRAYSVDSLQNAEDSNPDPSKSDFDHDFGSITWKTRKPRGRSLTGVGAEFSGKESPGWFGSNADGDCYPHHYGNLDIACDRDRTGVRRWLEERGFGEYASVFEMHEVDEDALPLLTLTDLKEMGVFAVGHRRKLFTAIQELRCGP